MSSFGFYVHHRANGVPFYVGKGTEMRARLMSRRNNVFHRNVVAKEGKNNISVTFTPCNSEAEAFRNEMALISLYRAIGIELVNATDGGEGPSNPRPEVRAKISAARKKAWRENRDAIMAAANTPEQREGARERGLARKGIKLSAQHIERLKATKNTPQYREKLRRANIGKKASADTKTKQSAKHKALWQNPEHREKMRLANSGRKHSAKTKAKMSRIQKALKNTPEYKAAHPVSEQRKKQIAKAMKARWLDPDYRARIITGITGKKHSTEARAKISESIRTARSKPEVKARYSAASKALWSNPDYRKRVKEGRKKKCTTIAS